MDAFAKRRYSGNPAAVVLLGQGEGRTWPNDNILQSIAEENNLSETAFVIGPSTAASKEWKLRWFTPRAEVDLCGHATLATAHVIFNRVPHMSPENNVTFDTRSGKLFVERAPAEAVKDDDSQEQLRYCMTFPIVEVMDDLPSDIQDKAITVFGLQDKKDEVQILRAGPDVLIVTKDWKEVANAQPDMSSLDALLSDNQFRGSIITADVSTSPEPLEEEPDLDFVSRFFAPNLGIPEDPATGSAHCALCPFWAKRRGLAPESVAEAEVSTRYASFKAKQMSKRGGYVDCELHTDERGNFVCKLIGQCQDFLDGMIDLEEPQIDI